MLEAPALLDGVRELVKAIAELDAVEVELKARRHRRLPGLQARERGLRGGVIADETRAVAPELRCDREPHQQIELGVAVEIGLAGDAQSLRRAVELAIVRAVRIDSRVLPHRVSVGEAPCSGGAPLGPEQ